MAMTTWTLTRKDVNQDKRESLRPVPTTSTTDTMETVGMTETTMTTILETREVREKSSCLFNFSFFIKTMTCGNGRGAILERNILNSSIIISIFTTVLIHVNGIFGSHFTFIIYLHQKYSLDQAP